MQRGITHHEPCTILTEGNASPSGPVHRQDPRSGSQGTCASSRGSSSPSVASRFPERRSSKSRGCLSAGSSTQKKQPGRRPGSSPPPTHTPPTTSQALFGPRIPRELVLSRPPPAGSATGNQQPVRKTTSMTAMCPHHASQPGQPTSLAPEDGERSVVLSITRTMTTPPRCFAASYARQARTPGKLR